MQGVYILPCSFRFNEEFLQVRDYDYAVIPRRLTELVAQVDEVAQRLVSIVKKVIPSGRFFFSDHPTTGRMWIKIRKVMVFFSWDP